MATEDGETGALLRRWHQGDRNALDALLQRELPWLQERVRQRLGPGLRGRAETEDYVHDALLDILRYGPRFVTTDRNKLRALLGRIVENTLRDRHDWYRAARRAASRERRLPSTVLLDLDRHGERSVTRPSEEAERLERQAWSHLALELLDPDDRDVIVARHWEGMSFADIGTRFGLTADAARMRLHRAMPKMARKLVELQSGRFSADGEEA